MGKESLPLLWDEQWLGWGLKMGEKVGLKEQAKGGKRVVLKENQKIRYRKDHKVEEALRRL